MIRVASRTPSQLVPVHLPDHIPGLGGDADHAVLAHVVSGLSVAPWVGGLWIVTDLVEEIKSLLLHDTITTPYLEASRQIVEHVIPDRHEALLSQLLPSPVHHVEVKHDHVVSVRRLIQVEVTIIEPDMVKNLLRKVSFPFGWRGTFCTLSKL